MGFIKEFVMKHPVISVLVGLVLLNRAEDAVGVYYAQKGGYNYKGHYRTFTVGTKEGGDNQNDSES